MSAITGTAGDAVFRCFAGIAASRAPDFVDELFSEADVMAATIAPDRAFCLPKKPVVRRSAAASGPGFAVICSAGMEDMPGANWKTLAEYEAARSELPAAIKFIFENAEMRPGLIVITRHSGQFALN